MQIKEDEKIETTFDHRTHGRMLTNKGFGQAAAEAASPQRGSLLRRQATPESDTKFRPRRRWRRREVVMANYRPRSRGAKNMKSARSTTLPLRFTE